MAGIRFAPSEKIRFYDGVNRTFYDNTDYVFNRVEEDPASLNVYNNFYLAIPLVQRENEDGFWIDNFMSDKFEVTYQIMMRYKGWDSFVYKYKAVAPASADEYLVDTNPNSQYFNRRFLLVKLTGMCGRLADNIEYQFATYALYMSIEEGITYTTKDECDDIRSSYVAINKPTAPFVYDSDYSGGDSAFPLKVSLSRGVSFNIMRENQYELLCFTDKLQLDGTATPIRQETVELMGEVRTFSNIDPETTSTIINVLLLNGTASAGTTYYIDKNKLTAKGATKIYFGVRLKDDGYGNNSDPDYSTIATRDWFRVDVKEKVESSIIKYSNFSCNFVKDLVDTDVMGNGYYAIKSGVDNKLTYTITGEFSSDCKFFLDLGLFAKLIELPSKSGSINLSQYSSHFIPRMINDDYSITNEILVGYSSLGSRDSAYLVVSGSHDSKRIDIRENFYSGYTGALSPYVRNIVNIYDYDRLKDVSLFTNSDTQPDCVVFESTSAASSTKTGYGSFIVKNPFYYYKQVLSTDTSTNGTLHAEYVNNNSIIKNDEVYAKILYNSSLEVTNSSGKKYTGEFVRDLNRGINPPHYAYHGFMVANVNIPYNLGVNDYTIRIITDDGTEIVQMPFRYVGTEATATNQEVPTLSIKPGVGVGINYDMQQHDDYKGLVIKGDLVIDGAIYPRMEENWHVNITNITLPWPNGDMIGYQQRGAAIVYVNPRIHNIKFESYLLEDMGSRSSAITVIDCKIYVEERSSGQSSYDVDSVLIDLTYFDNAYGPLLKRYVGRYTNYTGEGLKRYPMVNVALEDVPGGGN